MSPEVRRGTHVYSDEEDCHILKGDGPQRFPRGEGITKKGVTHSYRALVGVTVNNSGQRSLIFLMSFFFPRRGRGRKPADRPKDAETRRRTRGEDEGRKRSKGQAQETTNERERNQAEDRSGPKRREHRSEKEKEQGASTTEDQTACGRCERASRPRARSVQTQKVEH